MGERVRKNIYINDRRTTINIEVNLWTALEEVCAIEQVTPNELCEMIEQNTSSKTLSSGIRVFLLAYFKALRDLQREEGEPVQHAHALHLLERAFKMVMI